MHLTLKRKFYSAVFISGFSAMVGQIVFLREFLNVFMGNELITGVILGNWMLLTATGAFLGRFFNSAGNTRGIIVFILVLISVLLPVTLFGISFFKTLVYPPGTIPGLPGTWLFCILSMAPFCLLSGMLFTLFVIGSAIFPKHHQAPAIYGFEALGSIFAGVVFYLLLSWFYAVSQILVLTIILNSVSAIVLLSMQKTEKQHFIKQALIIILPGILIAAATPYMTHRQGLYRNQEIIYNRETPYGSLTVTRTGSQYNFFENNIPLFSTDNPVYREEAVHFTMPFSSETNRVLLVSGGVSGMADEIKKYPVDEIDYVEINPSLLDAGQQFSGFSVHPGTTIHTTDARRFIYDTEKLFDVAILNLPPPVNAQMNRYYTLEFFELLKSKLTKDGVISLSLRGSSNYLGKDAARLHGILYQTLKHVFCSVIVIPATNNYFVASDKPLSMNIIALIDSLAIKNEYVGNAYFNDDLLRMRSAYLCSLFPDDAPVNHDFDPVAYVSQINQWLSWFGLKIQPIAYGIIAVIFILLMMLSPVNKAMFAAGFTASSIEIMVLIAFQVVFGYFYFSVSLLISAFMAGLVIGTMISHIGKKILSRNHFIINQVFITISGILLPLILLLNQWTLDPGFFADALFYGILFLSGFLTGLQFSMAVRMPGKSMLINSSSAYGADLLGSAAGALIVASILIPFAGFLWSGIVLFVMNLLVLVLISFKGNQQLAEI